MALHGVELWPDFFLFSCLPHFGKSGISKNTERFQHEAGDDVVAERVEVEAVGVVGVEGGGCVVLLRLEAQGFADLGGKASCFAHEPCGTFGVG